MKMLRYLLALLIIGTCHAQGQPSTDSTPQTLLNKTITSAGNTLTIDCNISSCLNVPSVVQVKPTATLATTAALPTNTYSNGTSGVGATLTEVGNGALTVDSVAVATSNFVLVKNEVASANNGLYSVTSAGSAGTPYVLTRQVDMNTASEFSGAMIPVGNAGTTNANSLWLANPTTPVTVGTTSIPFTQLNGATDLTAGTGISISGNTISVSPTTGTGNVVFATSPTLTTPTLGAATATSINGNTFTTGTYTLTGSAGKTLTFSNSLTLAGTDATTMTFPATSDTVDTLNSAQTITAAKTFTNSDLLLLGSSTGANTFTAANSGASNYTTTVPANTGTLAETNLAQTFSALQTFNNSDIAMVGSSTGATTITSANAGGSNFTLTLPAATDTVADLAGSQAFTNKTYNGLTVTSSTGTLTIANGKTATVNNTMTLAGTDSATYTMPSATATVPPAVDVQTFTGSGTWTAPTTGTIKEIRVYICGGGGGGGGGAKVASGTSMSGGAGGGGAFCYEQIYLASAITAPVTVTIGAGGTAGTAGTAGAGGNGGQGGTSSFGSYLNGPGGGGGQGGASAAASGGGGSGSNESGGGTGSGGVGGAGGTPNGQAGGPGAFYQQQPYSGGFGAGGVNGAAGTNGGNTVGGPSGGGSGGGIAATPVALAGGAGGLVNTLGTTNAGGAAGTVGTSSTSTCASMQGGLGAGGGGSAISTNTAGAGGAGAAGSGAGGGGAALTTGTAGAGGVGGGGCVVVRSFF